jgi:hypothetical protein
VRRRERAPCCRGSTRLNGWQPATWPEFAAELGAVRLRLVRGDPGPGAVVTFRADGSFVVLARGLTTPAEYADVLLGAAPP